MNEILDYATFFDFLAIYNGHWSKITASKVPVLE